MQKPAVTLMVKAARAAGNVLLRHMCKLDSLNVVEKDRHGLRQRSRLPGRERDHQGTPPRLPRLRDPRRGNAARSASSRFTWVIDPLDGTSNYLRGIPHFCVSIALVENGEPIHGVIFDPLRNELFTASRGSGAVLNDKRDPRGRPQGPRRRDADHRLPAARARPRQRAAQVHRQPADRGRGHPPHRFGRARPGLRGLRPRRCLFRGRREALGHRRRRAAGARGRRQGLRLPRPHDRADGQPRPGRPPAGRRQHQGLRDRCSRRSSIPGTPRRSTEAWPSFPRRRAG